MTASKKGRLRLAFERTVRAAPLDRQLDAALIEEGRLLADQLDRAVAISADGGPDALKALYLLPHLTGILRELGTTPAARKAVERAARAAERAAEEESSGGVSRIAELQRQAQRHRTAS